MAGIALAYTSQAGQSYNVVFREFAGAEIARTYDGTAQFLRGANGAQLMAGRAGRQKFIWAVSGFLGSADAIELDEMFQAWDLDRSNGHAVAAGVVDETFGSPLTSAAIFSTPPSFAQAGPNLVSASLGLTEV